MREPVNDEQKARMEALLAKPVLARIASANPQTAQPHVVPVWYLWDGAYVWIHSYIGTRKINELKHNPRCSVLIDVQDAQEGLTAVLFEGQAELITGPFEFIKETATRIYLRYLGPEGILAKDPQSWLNDPENLLIKVTPQRTFSW